MQARVRRQVGLPGWLEHVGSSQGVGSTFKGSEVVVIGAKDGDIVQLES